MGPATYRDIQEIAQPLEEFQLSFKLVSGINTSNLLEYKQTWQ